MTKNSDNPEIIHPAVQPLDIIEGLGLAERSFLAACLALFEDSKLSKRVEQRFSLLKGWLGKQFDRFDSNTFQKWSTNLRLHETVAGVQSRSEFWRNSSLTDNDLRLILWIYLREAFDLPARLTTSVRGANALATEFAVAAIHSADPPNILRSWWAKGEKQPCVTLEELVQPVLSDLMAESLGDGEGRMDPADQARLIKETRKRLNAMSKSDQKRLLTEIGAKEFNDTAIRKMLITGIGLGAINLGVSTAGFPVYILAAQASAFIPMVSGPALVSLVSVLANPVTTIGGTAAAIWWFTSSVRRKFQAAIGLRLLALLALQGMTASDRNGIRITLDSFARAGFLKPIGHLDKDAAQRYWDELLALKPIVKKSPPTVDPFITQLMDRPAVEDVSKRSRLGRLLFPGEDEKKSTTAAVGALSLGDILYTAAAIDPLVIKAADFARIDQLGDPLAFASFARYIHGLSPISIQGADSNIKGYVAEQVVAAELITNGHQVEFPTTSNEPGWDLLVDGEKFQVKCLQGVAGLKAHFDKYDYPVLANSELADQIPSEFADKVFFVEGYSDELIGHLTKTSIEGGADVFDPDVLLFALGVSTVKNLMRYTEGKVSGIQAIEQILVDGSTRAGLAAVGGYAGTGIGLLVFGPAGALVLATALPVLSQAQANRTIKLADRYFETKAYRKWTSELRTTIDNFVKCLSEAIDDKLKILRKKYRAVADSSLSNYLRYRFTDDARFLAESQIRLNQLKTDSDGSVEQHALALIRWTASSSIHPARFQNEIRQLLEVLDDKPAMNERIGESATLAGGKAKELAHDVVNRFKSFRRNTETS